MLFAQGDQRQKRMRQTYVFVFLSGLLCFAGVQTVWKASLACYTQLDLLNPDTTCTGEQEKLDEWDYDPLRQELIKTVEGYTTSGRVPHIALFFRDLKNGPRFGIRENELFDPASLIKVPIMMVILHQADRNPELLSQRLTYEKDYNKDFILGKEEQSLQLHASYTVRELLQKMIRYSDNASSYLLLDKINELGLRQNSNTFADLGTMQLLMSGELDNTRLISLVNIFVALYNGNYLSPESSQFALELLTQTTYEEGIMKGVPDNIRVAHKFGIRAEPDQQNELHDCGIVYHPTTPYVLCVLTAGADVDTATAAIGEISEIVYENVDSLDP